MNTPRVPLKMQKEQYLAIKQRVISAGYGGEIEWVEERRFSDDPELFLSEYIYVVLNAGMREQVARVIFERIMEALGAGKPLSTVFGNRLKVVAIEKMVREYRSVFESFKAAHDPLAFLEGLPFIGGITKYHLARNLGFDYVKPDRHLTRIAANYNTTVHELCRVLALESGERIGTVDVVLWRAANLGFL